MPDIFDEVYEVKPDVFDEIESERESLRGQMREARAEAVGNKALTGLANIGERIGYTAALLGAKADPTGVVHNMLVREGYEVPSVIPPGFLEPDVRTVGEFTREGLGNWGIRPGPIAPEIERPLTEFAAENVAGLAEAAPQLVLGKFQPRPVARYFQGQMAAGLPGTIEQAVQAETPEEKLKAGLQLGANVAFPAAIELGLRQTPTRIPDIPGSILRMPEGAKPRVEPPVGIEIVQPEPVPPKLVEVGPKPNQPSPLPEIKAIAAETKVEPEVVEKGVRVEANDHPEVAKTNPELLPTLVKDELTLDKKAYDKDVDPGKAVAEPTKIEESGKIQRPTKLKPGFVRLWRGGTEGQEGLWFSDTKEVAEFHFENHAYDKPATLSYVDIPEADALQYSEAAFSHPDVISKKTIAEGGDHVLPPELASQARVVKRSKPTPPPAVSQGEVKAKQPWEMTKDEYHDEHLDDVIERRKLATTPEGKKPRHPDDVHRESVKLALSEGKPVPAEVLADYTDLAPKPIETRSRDLPLWTELQAGTREFNNRRTTKARKQEIISRQIELRKQLLENGYSPDQIKAVEMLQSEAPISPAQPPPQPSAGIEKQGAEGKKPFEVDDQLVMRSPHTGEDTIVSFRGIMPDGKAVVWTGKSQFPVPIEWLRRQGEKYEEQIPSKNQSVGSASVEVAENKNLGQVPSESARPLSNLSKEELVDLYRKEVPLAGTTLRSALLKKTLKSLRQDIENARINRQREAQELELTRQIEPEIRKLADDAGPAWRTALNKYAKDRGWSFNPPSDTTKGEYVAMLSLQQAKTQLKQSTTPPTPGPGAQTVGEPQKAQIEQLTDAFKGIEAEKTPLKEQVKEAFAIGEKFSGTKDLFSRALSGLKSSGDWFIQKWKGVENIDDLLRAKGDLSAQLQANSWRTKKWVQQAMKAIPRKRDQAAIAKWIDAGGDRAELERGMAETLPQYKQAYEDALNLKGDLLVAAQNAQNYFEARLQEAVDAGVLKAGVEDYIHRIYESRPDVEQKAIAHVQDGILKANPALAKKRVFQFDWEAEKLGYKPVQSFITRLAVYESSLARALAAREFIRKATTMKAADGRPVVDIKGVGIPLEDAATGERTGTLIKPQFNPAKANVEGTANYRGDYVNKEFPALSKWKWVSEDAGGKPILVQGDVAIHPDYVHRINALLEPSRVRYGRYGKILKPAMAVSSTVKQTMLDLSMFHQVQITVHGLEHKVLPGRIGIPWTKIGIELPKVPGFAKVLQDIDLDNPNVQGLLKGGISLGGEYSPYHAEGLVGSSLTRHIPFLGPLTQAYHDWLFQSYIPRIKMTMALAALERNRARYKGELTEEQILHKTASQANSAFGELNYIMLERSKTAQDISRLIMLAPDFLEARGRFAAEALTKGGKSVVPGFGNEQRAALLLGALTLYVTARIANKMINDQYHFEPENAFSIVKDGHAYSLRTVQGDILHLLAKPLQFWMNRLNPVYGRTLLQVATGRDYFGRKRSVPETLWDSVSNMMPIALRSSRERALWESIANSMGMQAKRWSDVDDAFTLAQKWKQKHGIGEKGEFIYDPDKDPLRSLKIALSHGDDAGAAKEIGKLTEGGTKISKLNDYFDRYASMPFTGKASNDRKWEKELTEDERKTVEVAREHKKSIKRLYIKARGQYFSAKNNPQ